MELSDAARLHHLEEENNRLKRLVADLSLDGLSCANCVKEDLFVCIAQQD